MTKLPFDMAPDAVYFVPLGGCGIFGANMTLYGHRGKWIMVDCGMGFADDTMPGIDILLPDPSFAEALGRDLIGIVLTHAHEDHIGALQHLWPRLKAPLYATPFTAARIRQSIGETPWGGKTPLHVLPVAGHAQVGDFSVQYIRMSHSIPEAHALAIAVPEVGTILHTGDWKIDPSPIVGELTDEAALRALGEKGVLATVGDSTNAMVPGHSGSEGTVRDNLAEMFGEFGNRIVVSCFSTNVARLHSIHDAARRTGRQVCLVGRSLWQVNDAARGCGYLHDVPPFLDRDEAAMLPPEKLVYVCTGSQGEPRAALSRISADDHPAVRLEEGDVVIFSSRAIPGNERSINRIRNRLYLKGVQIVTDRDAPIHVSGHPYREELKQFYGWLKPKVAIAVHGEQMQMEKHALLAAECGVPETIVPLNGRVIELTADGGARAVAKVQSGMLALEGNRIVAIDHEAIMTRRRMMFNGSAVITVVMNGRGDLLADPKVTAMGLLDENCDLDSEIIQEVADRVKAAVSAMPAARRQDDAVLSEAVRVTARRFFNDRFDRKPQTRVHLVRV